MESANLHQQHQLQEQFDGSSLATPSLYGVASNNNSWNPNLILNAGNFNLNINGVYSNSRDFKQNSDNLAPPLNTSMIQDSGFHWTSSTGSFTNQSAHELHLANKIKEELSDSNSSKFSDEEFHLPSTSYTKREQHDLHDLSEKLFLKTFSSGCQLNGPQVSIGEMYSKPLSSASFGGAPTSSKGYFSQISPSTYISNLNPSSPSFLNSLGMNFQALDLLNSTKFGGSFVQPAHNNNLGLFKESLSFGLEHMQESSTWPPNSPNKISSFMNGATETKRSSSFSEPKASHTATKKPRMETRSSLAPFKVRKEKLGDRIAALQQLVAPFGKTDTASVLMEAIGYIKFLQDQVETLSVPYMKASRNNTRRSIQEGSSEGEREEEPKRDLRSRGLCLVPLSCTSYIANDSLGVWPPTNFGGRT